MFMVLFSVLEITYWSLSVKESVVLTTFRYINNTCLPTKRQVCQLKGPHLVL